MKKALVTLAALATLAAPAHADDLFANDGTFLGNTGSSYDANSINNTYGQYGNPYSAKSINNTYGQYGSQYSTTSPNNSYAQPGRIVGPTGTRPFGGWSW